MIMEPDIQEAAMTRAFRHFKIMSSLVVVLAIMTVSNFTPEAYAGAAEKDEKDANRSVELNAMVFPVFEDGKLQNYLFVNARLRVIDGKSAWVYREKAHIIRDAILRATHRTSIHLKNDTSRIDERLAEKVCLEAANEVLGEDALISMNFLQVASQNPN